MEDDKVLSFGRIHDPEDTAGVKKLIKVIRGDVNRDPTSNDHGFGMNDRQPFPCIELENKGTERLPPTKRSEGSGKWIGDHDWRTGVRSSISTTCALEKSTRPYSSVKNTAVRPL